MRMLVLIFFLVAPVTAPVSAGTQTVMLLVPGMNCAACPITVKKALTRIDGVIDVEIRYGPREAVVTFDDTKTSIEALTQATASVGYPSKPKQ